jgi:hypothetical protein
MVACFLTLFKECAHCQGTKKNERVSKQNKFYTPYTKAEAAKISQQKGKLEIVNR